MEEVLNQLIKEASSPKHNALRKACRDSLGKWLTGCEAFLYIVLF